MKQARLTQILTLFGTTCCLMASIFIFRSKSQLKIEEIFNSKQIVQNTYLGPTSPVLGNPKLILVEVIINDDPALGGVEIQNVEFNETSIPLKPRDVYGFRGQGSFQLPPGKYKLVWTVNRDKSVWPRSVSHEELVTLSPRDLWVQITIQGETASIR
jgi:hypothetical protein